MCLVGAKRRKDNNLPAASSSRMMRPTSAAFLLDTDCAMTAPSSGIHTPTS
jgi:hypothetical protein